LLSVYVIDNVQSESEYYFYGRIYM